MNDLIVELYLTLFFLFPSFTPFYSNGPRMDAELPHFLLCIFRPSDDFFDILVASHFYLLVVPPGAVSGKEVSNSSMRPSANGFRDSPHLTPPPAGRTAKKFSGCFRSTAPSTPSYSGPPP